ncbi:MAG: hypothetical protein KF817_15605 [Phycisphaeraceae bacterium]|nr:hypothetical protein [Phycisphaeraceae bacterium]
MTSQISHRTRRRSRDERRIATHRSGTPGRRSALRSAVGRTVLVLLAVLLVPVRFVSAQGAMGIFPGPLSAAEIGPLSAKMGLSREQSSAVMSIHDEYMREFRALRDGDMQTTLNRMMSLQSGVMPDLAELGAVFKAIETTLQRVARVDDRFFDRVQGVLTADQVARLNRARMARERARYSGSAAMFGGAAGMGSMVDLAATIEGLPDLDIPEELRPEFDAILESYERRLTSDLGRISREGMEAIFGLPAVLAELGITPGTNLMEGDTAERLNTIMMERMGNMMRRQGEMGRSLRTLARSTAARLAATLPEFDGRRIRIACAQAAHPDLWGFHVHEGFPDIVHSARQAAGSIEDATARDALLAAAQEADSALHRLFEQAIARSDEAAASINPFEWDQEAWQEIQRAQEALRTSAQDVKNRLVDAMKSTLGADWRAELLRRNAVPGTAVAEQAPAQPEPADADDLPFHDWSRPTRLTRQDMQRMTALLDLDEGHRAIIDQLHADYIEKVRASGSLEQLRDVLSNMWSHDAETGQARYQLDAAGQKELRRLRRSAVEEMAALEASLFRDMAIALGGPSRARTLKAVAALREVDLWNRSPHSWFGGGAIHPAAAALLPVVTGVRTLGGHMEAAVPVLEAFAETALPIARGIFDAGIDLSAAQEHWQYSRMQSSQDGFDASAWTEVQRLMDGPNRAIQDGRRRLRPLCKRLVQDLSAVLPSPSARELERNFYRAAYPAAFAAATDLSPVIDRALALPDLTASQREKLEELTLHYRAEFSRLSVALIDALDAVADLVTPIAFDDPAAQEAWRTRAKLDGERERLEFDLDQLLHRTSSELRVLLEDGQLATLGPLPAGGATGTVPVFERR